MQIAKDASLAYEVIHDPSLELDLDTADDLSELEKRKEKKDAP